MILQIDFNEDDFEEFQEVKLTRKDLSSVGIPEEVCRVFNSVKPYIPTAISIVSRIPVVGSKISALLELLLTIGNLVCPVTQSGSPKEGPVA